LKDFARRSRRIAVGADKAHDVAGLVSVFRELNVTAHVIQHMKNRCSAIAEGTTRQVGYGISFEKRWLVEKAFGWLKQTGPKRRMSPWPCPSGLRTSAQLLLETRFKRHSRGIEGHTISQYDRAS
jgi:hypothetical protein